MSNLQPSFSFMFYHYTQTQRRSYQTPAWPILTEQLPNGGTLEGARCHCLHLPRLQVACGQLHGTASPICPLTPTPDRSQSCPAGSLGNSPSLLSPIPLIPALNRSKGKKGPCYFKWGLTQLYKEHKIKPFSQAITPGQLKQAENSIPAHNCRVRCSLSLHILRLLEKGGREGQGTHFSRLLIGLGSLKRPWFVQSIQVGKTSEQLYYYFDI